VIKRSKQLQLAVAGWSFVSFAIVLLLRTKLGVAPYDVLNTGIAEKLGIAQGTASWLGCGVLVLIATLLGARPSLGTLAGSLLVGIAINAGLSIVGDFENTVTRWVVFFTATVQLYLGVCCLVLSRFGKGPTELLTMGLIKRGASIRGARWITEGGCLAVGSLLGGGVGPGTVLLVVASGPLLARMLPHIALIAAVEFQPR
jgi:uncharacterized membrane protein YczE